MNPKDYLLQYRESLTRAKNLDEHLKELKQECKKRLPEQLRVVLERFEQVVEK